MKRVKRVLALLAAFALVLDLAYQQNGTGEQHAHHIE